MSRKGPVTKFKWMPLPKTEKAESLNNPYCGLYAIYRFYADSAMLQPEGKMVEQISINTAHQLCLVEINLLPYNEMPLSEKAINNIERIFQYFIIQKKQMIVRFVYDWEGKGILNEPKDITIILNHMKQLSLLLKEYTNNIYIVQGLFIGSWGEMHSSRYLSDRNMARLAKQLYECTGENTQIALRCPSFWRMLFQTYKPLDAETGYTDIQKARFSLFNDGMMASEVDFGTYGDIKAIDSKEYSDKWVREDELKFQSELCNYVSNGGEVINECAYNDPALAISTLREMKVSYLHSEYDEQVLHKWKKSKCGFALWKEKTAYDYITAHLGYRFTLEEVDLSLASDKSGNIKVSIKIINMGFSPCYHKFEVKLIIRTAALFVVHECTVDTDTRKWLPNEMVLLEAVLPAAEWLTEKEHKQYQYSLCMGIYDPLSEQPIKIANTFAALDYTGVYSLGNFILGN